MRARPIGSAIVFHVVDQIGRTLWLLGGFPSHNAQSINIFVLYRVQIWFRVYLDGMSSQNKYDRYDQLAANARSLGHSYPISFMVSTEIVSNSFGKSLRQQLCLVFAERPFWDASNTYMKFLFPNPQKRKDRIVSRNVSKCVVYPYFEYILCTLAIVANFRQW